MYTLDQVLDLAKARNDIKSDRGLARELGIANLAFYRNGMTYPSDATCVRLAALADLPPQALIAAVHIMKEPDGKVREIYKQWMDQATAAGLAFVFALGMLSAPAPAAASTGQQAASTPGEYILCKMI